MKAYEQFLALAKPYAFSIRSQPSPLQDEEEIRRAFDDLVRRELGIDDEGLHSETLFRLRKLIETTIYLGKKHEGHWQLLYTITDSMKGVRRVRPFSDGEA